MVTETNRDERQEGFALTVLVLREDNPLLSSIRSLQE